MALFSRGGMPYRTASSSLSRDASRLVHLCCHPVPAGAWFPIAVAGGVFLISYLWKWGTSRRLAHSAAHGVQLDDVLQEQETPDGPVRFHCGRAVT